MELAEVLLKPISDNLPCGLDLRNESSDQTFAHIREARNSQVDEEKPKPPDHKKASELAFQALETKTKDLQIAVWLTDSLINRKGFAGLLDGLELIIGLIENYWDNLYPEGEDGDFEVRAAPLNWLGNYLELAKQSSPLLSIQLVALTENNLTAQHFKESRGPKQEGKITAEVFDAGVEATKKSFYKERAAELDSCLKTLERLSELCQQKFGRSAPDFFQLRNALKDIREIVSLLLNRKLATDPDIDEIDAAELNGTPVLVNGVAPHEDPELSAALPQAIFEGEVSGLAPKNRPEAVARLAAIAKYLRKSEPSSPVSYLLLRALRWGELRAYGPELKSTLLAAPPTELRVRIKSLAVAGQWADLLEHTEAAMAAEYGRAWLDLQRYAVTACEKLGRPEAAAAIKSELSCLLGDFPLLSKAILLDDTGAANPETIAWLNDAVRKGN